MKINKSDNIYPIDYNEHEENSEIFPNISNVASATETTGAMQTPPLTQYEYSSYQDLVNMGIPKVAPHKENGKKRIAEDNLSIKRKPEETESPRA